MFHELVADPGNHDAGALHAAYLEELRAVVDSEGVERVAERSGVGAETLEALLDGAAPDLDLEAAAAILAVREDVGADGEEVAALSRDALLIGMTNAVLDVESLAAGVDGDLEPREIQSKVEGRYPMTLREFARLHAHLQSQTV